ncbi:UPF0538 protein C2orf76 homolog [Lepeophtheirus salmonis]|uniref:UPF0538 protein C2orf76 homolog n=1 Tax=Lepeophtheirus salmonis TaxID=72036 RepID=UPI00077F3367|nr:UPF0538 protein C2orf76 homolog [Lepeophtheirus salmonis]
MSHTLRIRIIRSFQHRNIRYITLHNVPFETTTVSSLMKLIIEEIKKSGLPPPFKTYSFDTLKIEHNAFGAKTNDPVINREDDDKLLLSRPDLTLKEYPLILNETEISFFKMSDYKEYLSSPSLSW